MYVELEAEILRSGIRKADIAKQMGIGYNTLLDKLKKKSVFTLDEAAELKEIIKSEQPYETLFKFTPKS